MFTSETETLIPGGGRDMNCMFFITFWIKVSKQLAYTISSVTIVCL